MLVENVLLHYIHTANHFVEQFQNSFLEIILRTGLGCVHTANVTFEITQLREECRTIGHVLWLSKDGFSESGSLYAFVMLKERAVAVKRANPRMRIG